MLKSYTRTGGRAMTQRVDASLTPEERAEVMRIQDRLGELFVDRGDAVAAGNSARADMLQCEIDDLLRESEDIRRWVSAPAERPSVVQEVQASAAVAVSLGVVRTVRF